MCRLQGPRVSVIVPVFNREKLLPLCLESLGAQDYDDYEVLVVDDGPTDRSRSKARPLWCGRSSSPPTKARPGPATKAPAPRPGSNSPSSIPSCGSVRSRPSRPSSTGPSGSRSPAGSLFSVTIWGGSWPCWQGRRGRPPDLTKPLFPEHHPRSPVGRTKRSVFTILRRSTPIPSLPVPCSPIQTYRSPPHHWRPEKRGCQRLDIRSPEKIGVRRRIWDQQKT